MKKGKLYLYDEIGPYGMSAGAFQERLDALKAEGVEAFTLYIYSPGGDVFDAIAIYNALKGLDDLTVVVTGLAASAASFIAMAGTTIQIVSNSFFMIHNPWTWVSGDADYLKKVQENLEMIQDVIESAYVERTAQEQETIREWMKADTWFKAEEAVEKGFADEVVEPGAMAKFKGFLNFLKPNERGAYMEKFKQMLIAAFGLTLAMTDDEASFVDAIKAKLSANQDQIHSLNEEKTRLEQERDAALAELKAHRDERIAAVLDAAQGRGAITEAERGVWKNQLEKDFDGTKAILDAKPSPLREPVAPPEPPVQDRGETAETAEIIRNQMQGKAG